MAINKSFSGVNVYPPGGSGLTVMSTVQNWPGYTRHEYGGGKVLTAQGLEDARECLAFLRALRNVRLITGVRCSHIPTFYINASVPNE